MATKKAGQCFQVHPEELNARLCSNDCDFLFSELEHLAMVVDDIESSNSKCPLVLNRRQVFRTSSSFFPIRIDFDNQRILVLQNFCTVFRQNFNRLGLCNIDRIKTNGVLNLWGSSFASPSGRTHSRKHTPKTNRQSDIVVS